MKSLIFATAFAIAILLSSTGICQTTIFEDNFDKSGEIITDNWLNSGQWTLSTGLNGTAKGLVHNNSVASTDYISHSFTNFDLSKGNITWSFIVKHSVASTTGTYWRISLFSDNENPSSGTGFSIGTGINSLNKLRISFFKPDETSETPTPDYNTSTLEMAIKVTRTVEGVYTVYASADANLDNAVTIGSFTDTNNYTASYFCIKYVTPVSNVKKLSVDEILITQEVSVDNTPPEISSVTVTDSKNLKILFNESLDKSSAETLSNYSITGFTISSATLEDDNKTVDIILASELSSGSQYTISINGVKDLSGNACADTDKTFNCMVYPIINEIMPYTQAVSLPGVKYIELYNPGTEIINIKGFKLNVGDKQTVLPEGLINPRGYLIITDDQTGLLSDYGNVCIASAVSSLIQSKPRKITLTDAADKISDSLTYSPVSSKNKSLERIDPSNRCNQTINWIYSTDPAGGTPGRINSVDGSSTDNQSPEYLSNEIADLKSISILFNENIKTADIELFTLDGNIKPINVNVLANKATLVFENEFSEGIHTVTFKNIEDPCGNINTTQTDAIFKYQKPVIVYAGGISNYQVLVYFSSEPNVFSKGNFSVEGLELLSATAYGSTNAVMLSFSGEMQTDKEYNLKISSVTDIYGSLSENLSYNFVYHPVNENDLVITEIMADVNPAPANLPAANYVELFNRSGFDIALAPLYFYSSSEVAFTQPFIAKGEYMILSLANAVYAEEIKTDPVLTSSSITVSGKELKLYTKNGDEIKTVINSVTYSSDWYNNTEKAAGGWSLEKIDAENFCTQKENWTASTSVNGGTPGKTNSVAGTLSDTTKAEIISAKAIYSKKLVITLNKQIKGDLSNYDFPVNGNSAVSKIHIDNLTIELTYNESFNIGSNNLTVNNLTDYCGNVTPEVKIKFNYEKIKIISFTLLSSNSASIVFNQNPDVNTVTLSDNYSVLPENINVKINSDNELSYILTFDKDFIENINYTLTIKNISDPAGMLINDTSLTIRYHVIAQNELLINEILFNPVTGGSDFIELYNNTEYEIQLNNLQIFYYDPADDSNIKYCTIATDKKLSSHAYAVISPDTSNIKSNYTTGGVFVQCEQMPGLPDEEGIVVIKNFQNSSLDSVYYSSDMHFALITDENGVSLERLSFTSPSDDVNNWHSAAQTSGFATPGLKNSQSFSESASDDKNDWIIIENESFTPDGDGYKDYLIIKFQTSLIDPCVTIKIYNSNGYLLRDLADNVTVSQDGLITWDGTDNNNNVVNSGIFVIYAEIFSPAEKTSKKVEKACVVYRK